MCFCCLRIYGRRELQRGRTNSLPTLVDLLKWKREENSEKVEEAFKKSCKTVRSPSKKEVHKMESNDLQLILKQMKEMNEQFQLSRKRELQEIKQEIKRGNKEIRDELKKRDENWAKEREKKCKT